jgi:hypothetical protein
MLTRVQFVTTPAIWTEPSAVARVIRSSTAVALKSLILGKDRTLERSVEVKSACTACY